VGWAAFAWKGGADTMADTRDRGRRRVLAHKRARSRPTATTVVGGGGGGGGEGEEEEEEEGR